MERGASSVGTWELGRRWSLPRGGSVDGENGGL